MTLMIRFKKNFLFPTLLLLFASSLLYAHRESREIDLTTRKIFDNRVSIKIPGDFTLMSEAMIKLQYPNRRRPSIIYTNPDSSVNIAFNYTDKIASEELMPSYKQNVHRVFRSMYPDAEWIETGIKKIHGRSVAYQELISPIVTKKFYNLMFYTHVNGRLFIVSFNCEKRLQAQWQKTAHKIFESLMIQD